MLVKAPASGADAQRGPSVGPKKRHAYAAGLDSRQQPTLVVAVRLRAINRTGFQPPCLQSSADRLPLAEMTRDDDRTLNLRLCVFQRLFEEVSAESKGAYLR